MKTICTVLLYPLLLFCVLMILSANDQVIKLGGEGKWDTLFTMDGLTVRKGRAGNLDLLLKDSEYISNDTTDLLLHFNALPVREESSHYYIQKTNIEINMNYAKFGEGCGVFQSGEGLTLVPLSGNLFLPRTT